MIMLTTPFGRPASCRMATSASAVAGVWPAGLITTVFPKARAGAIFQAGMAMGKFHGVIRP